MARTFSGSTSTPFLLTTNPTNFPDLTQKVHFAGFSIIKNYLLHLAVTCLLVYGDGRHGLPLYEIYRSYHLHRLKSPDSSYRVIIALILVR